MTKPHAEIREALVTGIHNNPEKSARLKAAAEIWIAVIDNIQKYGDGLEKGEFAFQMAHARFLEAAKEGSFPDILSPAEIAKAFGLVGTSQ